MPAFKSLAVFAALLGMTSAFVAPNAPVARTAAVARPTLKAAESAIEKVSRSVAESDASVAFLFENNKKWVEETTANDPDAFERQKSGQAPRFLYIGCSDSRVTAEAMMGLKPGELFVHRNVANLVINTDYSLNSVVMFAVEVLKVQDIIVCGHYGCGGVKAATENKDHGAIEHWLMNIRNVQRLHQAELEQISDEEERFRRLVELNVQESCISIFANPSVQKMQAQTAAPRVHGFVFDIGTGYLKDLKIDFQKEIRQFTDIYRLYERPGY